MHQAPTWSVKFFLNHRHVEFRGRVLRNQELKLASAITALIQNYALQVHVQTDKLDEVFGAASVQKSDLIVPRRRQRLQRHQLQWLRRVRLLWTPVFGFG